MTKRRMVRMSDIVVTTFAIVGISLFFTILSMFLLGSYDMPLVIVLIVAGNIFYQTASIISLLVIASAVLQIALSLRKQHSNPQQGSQTQQPSHYAPQTAIQYYPPR